MTSPGLLNIRSVLWIKLCPPKRYVEVLNLEPQNVTLFGKKVSVDVIELR